MAKKHPRKNVTCDHGVNVAILSYTTMPVNVVKKNHVDWYTMIQ
tara:strand:- start:24 stop:155 length:132 start_codon:yes stop_codon:yes gene_type:complete